MEDLKAGDYIVYRYTNLALQGLAFGVVLLEQGYYFTGVVVGESKDPKAKAKWARCSFEDIKDVRMATKKDIFAARLRGVRF